ncbi:hypothetical protein PQR14_32200 [Paraburkholderia bryophila]|uniref:hypothetical protein n=1 Tax=Paraburkholderia bryophila TaxID=420952 RepID=UPI0038B82E74
MMLKDLNALKADVANATFTVNDAQKKPHAAELAYKNAIASSPDSKLHQTESRGDSTHITTDC